MSKFRSGYHNLEIELGRHDGGVREIKGYVVYAISVQRTRFILCYIVQCKEL